MNLVALHTDLSWIRRLPPRGLLLLLLCWPLSSSAQEWSPYQPLPETARNVPTVADAAWSTNAIDAFVYAKLKSAGLQPPAETDRRRWLRRVTFDLIGLPPTADEMKSFLADPRPDELAYADVVDRLLASPHYGERWARHWLDVVRYADTDGFAIDEERPRLWRYRDYAVRHFNDDRPYDQFIREQLAGDLLNAGSEAVVATSFYRLGPYEADNMTPEHRQQDFLNEITTTVGTAFLGLTIGCARCHDHKYDPIPQRDFYRLQALVKPAWRGEKPADFLAVELPSHLASRKTEIETELAARKTAVENHRAALKEKLAAALNTPANDVSDELFNKALKGEKISLAKPEEKDVNDSDATEKDAAEKDAVEKDAVEKDAVEKDAVEKDADAKTDAAKPDAGTADTFQLSKEDRDQLEKLETAVKDYDVAARFLPVVDSINFASPKRKKDDDEDEDPAASGDETFVLMNGDPFAPGERVQPGCLSAVDVWSDELQARMEGSGTSPDQRRTALADWIASSANPLTMRVYVNRIWQYHFASGIVRTANDFGENGSGPSHPELLDYLAATFVENGLHTKPLHRLIVLSRTYRSASQHADWAHCATVDPDNRLLWVAPLRRLEAEVVRDALLAVSGRLNTERGGPGFYEVLPDGMPAEYPFFKWHPSAESQRERRSIYMFQRRNLVHPMMEALDVADANQSCERRSRSVTASQALALINGEIAAQASLHMARRLCSRGGDNVEQQTKELFLLTLGRSPDAEELADCVAFLADKTQAYVAGHEQDSDQPAPPLLALRDLCLVMLNTNEFLYLD